MKMSNFNLALRFSAIVFYGLYFSLAQAETLTGRVVKISDGDTVTVLDASKQQHKIRLMGIDAPEKKQAFGNISKQHLADLIFGNVVSVEWFKRDRYQRVLGKILLNGRDVNLEQIKAGQAWHYKRYQGEQLTTDRRLYADAEETARLNRVGLWRDSLPVPPWDYRHNRSK